jgi:UTP--glucose-1-phosphate uridylyltransferase
LVVEEAASVGLHDVLLVTGRNKRALEDHFDQAAELETTLEAKGDMEKLALVRRSTDLADVHYVRQGEPKGLGHAVGCARRHVGDEPFAVLLGDDLIDVRDELLSRMVALRERFGGSVVALMEVPRSQIHLYGCAAFETLAELDDADVVRVTDLVEKPSAEQAPSTYAVIGRYVLDPAVFDVLERTPPGRGGEVQLTDALRELSSSMPAEKGGGVLGVVFRGRRYDTGDRLSYLQAVIRLASEREDLGPDLNLWLRSFVAELPGGAQ